MSRILNLSLLIIFGLLGTQCATPKEEHVHGELAPVKTYPKDYVHPLTEINLEKVINENRGLKVVEENATTVHDYYRGGVQVKEEGERLLREERWEEAVDRLETSNRFFRVVLKYIAEDEAYGNLYGNHSAIFLPNLLSADNYLKLIDAYKKLKRDDKATEAEGLGEYYLSQSLRHVKTEWAFQIKKGFGQAFPKR